MKDICQRFANKVEKNINSFQFLYGGNKLNFLSSFKDLVRDKNEMKVSVYTKEDEGFMCPKCGEKIKLKTERIDAITSSISNLKETISSAKLIIESVIKISSIHNVNIQLKPANVIIKFYR